MVAITTTNATSITWIDGARMHMTTNAYMYTPPVTTAPISFADFVNGTREGWLPHFASPSIYNPNKDEALNKRLPKGTKVLFEYGGAKKIGIIIATSFDGRYHVDVEGKARMGSLGVNMSLLSSKEEIE